MMARLGLNIVCWAVYLFLAAPLAVVVGASFNAGGFLAFPPRGLSLRWYETFLHNDVFLTAIQTSLSVAFISTVLSLAIGTAATYFYVRHAGRWRGTLRIALLSPLLLPDILTAIALLFFFYVIGFGARGMVALIAGHVLITLPFVFLNVVPSMESLDPALERAAQGLGANATQRFFRVVLPLLKPGLIAGGLFAFIVSFDTFAISFMLKSIGTTTLPIQLYDYLRMNFTPEAAAVSTCGIVLTLLVVIAAEKLLHLRVQRF